MAANINRVVLVGNLTRDPELRHTPGGTPVCSLRIAVNSRRKDESGQWVDKPNYFSISVFGNQAESCAQYLSQGPPRRDRRPPRLARVGGARTAAASASPSRSSPTASSSSAAAATAAAAAAAATSSCRPARAPSERRLPGRSRRRHPLLGERMAPRERTQTQRKRPGGPAGAVKRRNCFFCKDKIAEIDYKNVNQLRRYISEKGKIRSRRITRRLPPPPGAGRDGREAGARDGAPAVRRRGRRRPRARRRRPRPPRPRGPLMDVILLKDVEKVGLRGDVVSVARGYARNFLFPRKLAEEATAARVAELQKRDSQRARHEAKTADEAQAIADDAREDRAALRGEGRPDRLALRLGDADRHRGRDLARRARSASTAARSASTTSSGSAATRCRSTSSRTCASR